MKKRITLWVYAILILLLGFNVLNSPRSVRAQTKSSSVNADQALCLPGGSESTSGDCLLAGPSRRLSELSSMGITFPANPLPLVHPPYELFKVPFSYALLDNTEVPLYATLEDAINNHPSGSLAKSKLKYISYVKLEVTDQGKFYQDASGQWMSADFVRRVAIPYYQGYLLKADLSGSFGWVLQETRSRSAPGYAAPETKHSYFRLDMVHVYDTRVVDNMEWEMVGPDEWIEHRFVGKVTTNSTPPEGVTNGRWIEVNLFEQTLMVYDNQKLIFATLVATGSKPFYTRPGTFKIYKKLVNDEMYGAFEADRSDYYYLEDVPYIMYYDEARALHGAYWNTMLGYPASHGCVNLSVADAHWLFDWANEGDTVYVWDPSGKTPTDPSYYGPGGA